MKIRMFAPYAAAACLSGCGLVVPSKSLLGDDSEFYASAPANTPSPHGAFESNVISHIRCQIRNGLHHAMKLENVAWLAEWGAKVTLKLIWEEQSNLGPGGSWTFTLGGKDTFGIGLGVAGSAQATRQETITFTYSNRELLDEHRARIGANQDPTCRGLRGAFTIESDLKIAQFIYDKAFIAQGGAATTGDRFTSPFSVFQTTITFVTSLEGSITPSWKLTRVSYNPDKPFLKAARSNTSEVLITLGQIERQPTRSAMAVLRSEVAAQHLSALSANFAVTAIQGQRR